MRIGNAEVCDDCGASYSDHAKGCSKSGPGPMTLRLDPKQRAQEDRKALADQFSEDTDTTRTQRGWPQGLNPAYDSRGEHPYAERHPLGRFNPDTSPDDDLL